MKLEDDRGLTLNLGCGSDMSGDVRLDLFRDTAANVIGDASQLPFCDGAFSLVYERNILEHMPNPAVHLGEVNRVLKNGGRATIITDNAACLKYYTMGTHTGGYRKQEGKDVHYALFTEEHLRNLMKVAQLEVESMEFIDTDHPSRIFDRLVRFLLPSLSYPRILVGVRKR